MSGTYEKGWEKQECKADSDECQEFKVAYDISAFDWRGFSVEKILSGIFFYLF